MKNSNFLILLFFTFFLFSCTKSPVATPSTSEIDFTSSNYYSPADIKAYKTNVECSDLAYWEGKKIKLQGFCFSGNIDTVQKYFFLYEKNNISEPVNPTIVVYYGSKDSVIMAKKLWENRDKHCIIQAICLTNEGITIGCRKSIKFTLAKPEDLEFK